MSADTKANPDSTQVSGQAQLGIPPPEVISEIAAIFALGLGVASSAIGRSMLLRMSDSKWVHPALNVIVATNAPGLVMDALASVLAPLKHEQARRHLALAHLDPDRHKKALEEAKEQRQAYEESDCMPAPEHLAHFDQRLAELNGLTMPMMLLENPAPGRLTLAIGKSPDACLLVTLDDLSFSGLLNAARTTRGAMDFELLGKSFRQEIFDAAYLEGITDNAAISPIVTLIAVVRPETAARFLSSPVPLVAGFADTCLVVGDFNDMPVGNPDKTGNTVAESLQIVSRLLTTRDDPIRMVRLSQGAGDLLAGHASRVAEAQTQVPVLESGYLRHSPRITAKLALLKHVTQGDSSTLIPGEIAASAVAAAEISWKHRMAVLEAVCTEPAAKALQTAVFNKVVKLGPLTSTRDICRHSRGLRMDALAPVLDELVNAGKVVKERPGRYSAVPAATG